MLNMARRIAILIFGMCLIGAGAWAQDARPPGQRDLNVEVTRPQARPFLRRPAHSASRLRPVQVSLMPVGPSTITVGDPIRFRMLSLANGFGHLYVLSASGRTQVWLENIPVRAARPIRYPLAGKTVRASPPAGDEKIIFVVTRRPFDGFSGHGTNIPFDLQFTREALRTNLEQKLAALPRADWGFAEIGIRVRD